METHESRWVAQCVMEYSCREEAIASRRTMGKCIGVELNKKAVRNKL